MLVVFSCKAYENITMFGDVALKLLKIMGHSGTIPGALLADDVQEALTRLQQAVSLEKGVNLQPKPEEQDADVSLRHRALPLIGLLDNAVKHHCNVMWEQG